MPLFQRSVDGLFVRFCRTGDPHALGQVFDRTAPELLRVACYLAGNRADAEDLVQRTFVTAIERRAAFAPEQRAMPWLCGLLANHARQLHRERRRVAPVRPEPSADPRDGAAERELQERLASLRAELGEPYAAVLQLHLEQGLNAKEIAQQLQRPAGTVRTQLMRALQQLQRRLPDGFLAGGGLLLLGRTASAASPALLAMRQQVVGAAAKAAATSASALPVAITGSWFVSKKIAVAASLVVAALLGGWFAWPSAAAAPPPAAPGPAPAVAAVAAPPAPRGLEDPAPARAPAAVDAAAEPDFAAVRVRVRWQHDGSPAAGVGVFAGNGRPVARRDAVTGSDGTALLPRLAPGTWRIGAVLADAPVERALEAGAVTEVALVAQRTAVARGRVLDPHGQPVADARIWLSAPGDWSHGHEVARSGADGTFAVPLLGAHYVGARKHGWTPSHTFLVHWRDEAPPAALELRLQHRGGTVRGVVQDERGAPVAFAKVLVGEETQRLLNATTSPTAAKLPRGVEVATDRDGGFLADGVPAGLLTVRAWASGHAPFQGGVDVPSGGEAELRVVLRAGATVRGTVRDEHGTPAAGAVVRWGMDWEFAQRATTADAAGAFALDDLPDGEQQLEAGWRGVRAARTLELRAGATAEWHAVLAPGRSITGLVRTAAGEPLAGYTIVASDSRGDHETTTGADGRFLVAEIGEQVELRVVRDFQVLLKRDGVVPGSQDVELVLGAEHLPTAWVTGRLLDERGGAVGAALLPWHPDAHMSLHYRSDPATGAFRVGPLRAGRYRLDVESADFGRRPLAQFELAPEQTLDLGDRVLSAPGAAEFRVTALGRPVPGGLLFLRRPDGGWTDTLVVEQGRARHGALPAGRLYASAEHEGMVQHAELVIAAGTTTRVDLDLQPAHGATVTLLDPLELPRERLAPQLIVRREDGSFAGLFGPIAPPGPPVFLVEVPPGRYTLHATAVDGRTATGTLDVRAGHATATLELPRAP